MLTWPTIFRSSRSTTSRGVRSERGSSACNEEGVATGIRFSLPPQRHATASILPVRWRTSGEAAMIWVGGCRAASAASAERAALQLRALQESHGCCSAWPHAEAHAAGCAALCAGQVRAPDDICRYFTGFDSFVWGTLAQVVAPRRDALAKDKQHAGARFVIIFETLLLNACTAHGPSAPAMNLAPDRMREECSMAHTCTA